VTRLRQMMLEELQRRNYSKSTTRYYLQAVANFARHFGKSPDKLGPDELRSYQAYLLRERKLAVGSVIARVAALRFFFVRTLKRHAFREDLPYPKDHRRLPTVLSLEEVARLINAAGNLLQRALHRHDWVVYAKPAFGGPMQVLRYLGRYTHRMAISNHRLLAFDQERVTFRWKDYARGGRQGQMTLTATEFLRRFFLHVLPKGFVCIRHFGFLANRFRASRLALGRQLLASSSATEQGGTYDLHSENAYLWHCPRCGASMIVIQRFTAAELSACIYFDSS